MERGFTILPVEIDASQVGERFDRAIANRVPDLSRERVQALLAEGRIAVTGAHDVPRASARVGSPMLLSITLPPPVTPEAGPEAMDLVIAWEDEHLVVVDKPAGMVVHPANGNPDGTLVNGLLHHCAGQLSGIGGVARPGIVHRIDKDTSGLIVVAKTDKAHEGLARQFFDHSIERVYQAIVNGHPAPPAGTVDAPLARSTNDRKKIAVVNDGRGKRAVTHFRTLERLSGAALVECRLETGRTHQVRVHMTHIGHALLGDPVYGRAQSRHAGTLRSVGFARQALHAARLGFIHPVTGATVLCDSPLPTDMQQLFTRLSV
ncbi:RluA family pseudouridine synthase [Sphingomonas lacunae]|uniref:Pseudouridine synthase n=1 Tax=Sphingomonas lacunae TaxID=2698828 RepID=A0A6M4B0U7_9SPHN|nr:RluA family pseudouridine synthase [Sphingomonas lacunae]QJQ32971.1 RluA family pseudouridine synthase [Sphingomonas lacunae]